METITKQAMEEFRKDIDAALLAVAQKHGMTNLQAMKGKYDPDRGNFSFTVEGVVAGGMDGKAFLYSLWAKTYEWPEVFSEFEHKGSTYKIIGCNTTKSKIYCKTGELVYEFPPNLVKQIFQVNKLKAAAKKAG